MLYYLFDYIERNFNFPGAGLFQYISFRAGVAAVLSLLITVFFGKSLINILRRKQVGEDVRDLGLEGQLQKRGTPTMGGIIIIAAILIPTFLMAKLDNVYVILLIATTIWLGLIGFLDDYIKVFRKNKEGLAGRFKIVGQVTIGLVVGLTLYFNDNVVIREKTPAALSSIELSQLKTDLKFESDVKSTKTTVPFLKNNEFDYHSLVPWLDKEYTWIIYTVIVILIITAVSNGVGGAFPRIKPRAGWLPKYQLHPTLPPSCRNSIAPERLFQRAEIFQALRDRRLRRRRFVLDEASASRPPSPPSAAPPDATANCAVRRFASLSLTPAAAALPSAACLKPPSRSRRKTNTRSKASSSWTMTPNWPRR